LTLSGLTTVNSDLNVTGETDLNTLSANTINSNQVTSDTFISGSTNLTDVIKSLIKFDSQFTGATGLVITTSTTPVDVDSMSLTTKDLGSDGNYLIKFDCAKAVSSSGSICLFYVNIDGVNVFETVSSTFANEIQNVSVKYLATGLTSDSVVKIQHEVSTGILGVYDRSLIIEGILNEYLIDKNEKFICI